MRHVLKSLLCQTIERQFELLAAFGKEISKSNQIFIEL